MKKNRVVVTGLGVVSPAGTTIESFWKNLVSAKTSIRKISSFNTEQFPTKFAGEITDFSPDRFLDSKKARRLDRFVQFALDATHQAVKQANIDLKNTDPYRSTVFIGSATGGQGWVFDQYEIFRDKGYKKLNPFTAASTFPNAVSSNIAIEFGLKGRCDTISSGCASSLSAIGYGFDSIRSGIADISVVGGSEALLYAPIFGSYSIARILSCRNGEVPSSPRPFDKDRDGTILGEGSGILFLENLEHAKRRGANIIAEILGSGYTADAFHMIAHEPTGMEMAKAIDFAVADADLKKTDIDYIHMHGMGDKFIDKIETNAVKLALGEQAYKIPTSAIKSMIGHCQGACGAIESIASILMMTKNIILPTINLELPDPECDLDYTPVKPVSKRLRKVMVNTMGFGGKNACLIIGASE